MVSRKEKNFGILGLFLFIAGILSHLIAIHMFETLFKFNDAVNIGLSLIVTFVIIIVVINEYMK